MNILPEEKQEVLLNSTEMTKKQKAILIFLALIFFGVSAATYWDLNIRNSSTNLNLNSNPNLNLNSSTATTATDKASRDLPPTAAITACENKETGTVCEFDDKGTVVQGQCDNKPGVMACSPNRNDQPRNNESAVKENKEIKTDPTYTSQNQETKNNSNFKLTSDVGLDGGSLPQEYTCDGAGNSPALSWTNAPAGTKEYAVLMSTIPVDGKTKWNWILYKIPANSSSLKKNTVGVGTLGSGSDEGGALKYQPPCSQGPGSKTYTFTIYALSASPALPNDPQQVTGEVFTKAISSITLGSASLSLSYARSEK